MKSVNPQLLDVHTHTQFAAFQDDYDAVIKRALDKGIWLVNVGTQKDTSSRAVEIAKEFPEGVYAAVGLHPIHTEKSYHDEQELGGLSFAKTPAPDKSSAGRSEGEGEFVSRDEEFDYEYYKELAQNTKVVAIGECGFDYYRLGPETQEKQKVAFLRQIELAYELKKPLMIHCRQAFADLIDVLTAEYKNLNSPSGVIHFFSGTVEEAQKLLDLGFSFSFGGVITFVHDYDEAVKYIPLDRIVLETDAPYVTPAPYRGKRNEPVYVKEVAQRLADIKNLTVESVVTWTTRNARQIFQI